MNGDTGLLHTLMFIQNFSFNELIYVIVTSVYITTNISRKRIPSFERIQSGECNFIAKMLGVGAARKSGFARRDECEGISSDPSVT